MSEDWDMKCQRAIGRSAIWHGTLEFSVSNAEGFNNVLALTASAGVLQHAEVRAYMQHDEALPLITLGHTANNTGSGRDHRTASLSLNGTTWEISPPSSYVLHQSIAPADLDLEIHATLTCSPVGQQPTALVIEAGKLVSLDLPCREPDVELTVDYGVWYASLSGSVPYTTLLSAAYLACPLWALSHIISVATSPYLHATLEPYRPASEIMSAAGLLLGLERQDSGL